MSRGAHCPGWNNYQLRNRNYRRGGFEAAADGHGPGKRTVGDPATRRRVREFVHRKSRFFFTGAEGRSECKNAENSIRVSTPEETMPLLREPNRGVRASAPSRCAGARWKLGPAFDVSLEASLTEPAGDGEPASGLVLRGSKRW